MCIGVNIVYTHVHERWRRKEERSKQGQTNNKATYTQHTQGSYLYMLMRDEEGMKKEASKVKQTTKQQSNTAHPSSYLYMLMRDEEGMKKEERSKQGQTNNKATKQHSTPKQLLVHVNER